MVVTSSGRISGHADGKVVAYQGIPYAAAPRFAAPGPREPWTGVFAADAPGPGAPQPPSGLSGALGPLRLRQDEDCLSLNVWTPSTSGSRPVLLWWHGGGFSSGASGQDWYDGARLAERGDLVVVTANYRLGAFGFLYFAELADGLGAGNFAVLDQLAALRWVVDNIAAFGGDPNRITVGGQSAGAASALTMLPSARTLISRIILQSAPLPVLPRTRSAATEQAQRFLHALDLTEATAHRVRELPVDQLLAAQVEVAAQTGKPLNLDPAFGMVADEIVAADPVRAAAEVDVDRLISHTGNELAAFAVPNPKFGPIDRERAIRVAGNFLGEHAEAEYTALAERFPDLKPAQLLLDLGTDHYFVRDIPRLASPRSFRFRFEWAAAPDNPFGACHCIDLPCTFDTFPSWPDAPMLAGLEPSDRAATGPVVARLQGALARFVHTGDPGWTPEEDPALR